MKRSILTLAVTLLLISSSVTLLLISSPVAVADAPSADLEVWIGAGTDFSELDADTLSEIRNQSTGSGDVKGIGRDAGDEIWVGDASGGLFVYNESLGLVYSNSSFASTAIDDIILTDTHAFIWVFDDGLYKVDRDTKNIVDSALPGGRLRQMELYDGNIYAGAYVTDEVYKIDIGSMSVEETFATADRPNGVTVTESGRIFVGVQNGQLYELDDTLTEVNSDTRSAGVRALDSYDNRLFLGDGDGVHEIDVDSLSEINSNTYSTADIIDVGEPLRVEGGHVYFTDTGDGVNKWNIDLSHEERATVSNLNSMAFEVVEDNGDGEAVETSLELEIDSWMPFDSQQDYTVILNQTNTTSGDTNLTDVTADANVTIYNISNTSTFNEPIATVNNTTDTIRSYNETGVVAVNATYDGNTVANASNLTVGNRNLSNIGIMPPEEWVCSFLICDENPSGGDNPHNIGSSMQWLLLIIVIMVAATRFVENPWAGVGTGIIFSILVWVLGFIDLGSVLVTVFSGLLIGAMMARTQMGRGVTRDNEQSGIDTARLERRR